MRFREAALELRKVLAESTSCEARNAADYLDQLDGLKARFIGEDVRF
jgi:hypothetical protein